MKKFSHHFTAIISFLFAGSSFCLGQNPPPLTVHGIRVFQHGDYSDPSGYVYQTEVADLGSWNHQISSLQVPAGYQLIAYENINFQGGSRIFIGDWTISPSDIIWNDRICSFKWMKIIYEAPAPVPGGGIKLWENENFVLPATITYKQEEPNLYFWDNRVGSIQVPEGYKMTAWEDMNFQGASIEISGNWTPGGTTQGWNKRISSYKLIKIEGDNPEPVNQNIDPMQDRTGNRYVRIANKYQGTGFSLTYLPDERKFQLKNFPVKWNIVTAGQNRYKIQVLLFGKLWALSTRVDGFLFLAEPSNDKYQDWRIDYLEDNSFSISNPSLIADGVKNTFLFADAVTNDLVLMEWKAGSTLNGRWDIIQGVRFTENDHADLWDNKDLRLRSVSNKADMCLGYLSSTDISVTYKVAPCYNRTGKISFVKTINGDYLMKMYDEDSRRWVYFDNYLNETTSGGPSPADPSKYQTWKIVQTLIDKYRIINSGTGYAMELIQDKGTWIAMMIPVAERTTQLWYLQ